MKLSKNLQSEINSWDVTDPRIRKNKLEREWVRYPYLIEKLGLDNLLYLEDKIALDIGCGPMGGILQLLPCRDKRTIDPLNHEYVSRFPEFYNPNIIYDNGEAEALPYPDDIFDLVITTNALDHAEDPEAVVQGVKRVIAPSGYFAVQFCLNLSKIHPHESHINAIDKEMFLSWVEGDFETIFCKEDKYGWVKHNGKVGQPALYYLGRMTTKGA